MIILFAQVDELLAALTEGSLSYEDIANCDTLEIIQAKIKLWRDNMMTLEYRTIKLWLQYLDLISLLKEHRNHERTGQFESQLKTLDEMRPYLASAGHHQYAKAITLYLNNMMEVWIEP